MEAYVLMNPIQLIVYFFCFLPLPLFCNVCACIRDESTSWPYSVQSRKYVQKRGQANLKRCILLIRDSELRPGVWRKGRRDFESLGAKTEMGLNLKADTQRCSDIHIWDGPMDRTDKKAIVKICSRLLNLKSFVCNLRRQRLYSMRCLVANFEYCVCIAYATCTSIQHTILNAQYFVQVSFKFAKFHCRVNCNNQV